MNLLIWLKLFGNDSYIFMFADAYNVQTLEETDIVYKKQNNLNLTLQYNEW